MAVGFTDGTSTFIPDRTMQRTSKPKVYRAAFGDGYEQRIAQGINNISESYSVSFVNRTKAEIDDIVAFFDSLNAVTNFSFTIPDSNAGGNETTIKVVCEDYSLTYTNDEFYGCQATFRRVYEP
jgi:phage-related protein